MKKRIIALVLACMLICSIAVTASAATATYSGRYGNCLYTATTTCSVRSYSASIEGTPVGGASDSDYILRADVYVVRMNPGLGDDIMETIVGGSSTGIAFNNKTYTANVFNITAYYYINGTQVYYKSLNAS